MIAKPIGRMISGPGPGIGPNKGDPSTKSHPIVSIVQRKVLVCRQDVRPDTFMGGDVVVQNFPASHGQDFLWCVQLFVQADDAMGL